MSDRLYLGACPLPDAERVSELRRIPWFLPFEPYVEAGVLHADGNSRINPRHDELQSWAFRLPDLCMEKWPHGHLESLFWKFSRPDVREFREALDGYKLEGMGGDLTEPRPAQEVADLIWRHVARARRAGDFLAFEDDQLHEFLAEHRDDALFLYVV